MARPLAVVRRDIIAETGPSIYGIKRMERVISPKGEAFVFLGVGEGIVHVEREDKARGEPFVEIDSADFSKWKKA